MFPGPNHSPVQTYRLRSIASNHGARNNGHAPRKCKVLEDGFAPDPEIYKFDSLKARCMKVEIEREDDGRWIAEVPDLPGVMAYGEGREDAIAKVEALALRVTAGRLDHGETVALIRGSHCRAGGGRSLSGRDGGFRGRGCRGR